MAGTTPNPSDTINGTPNSTAAGSYTPATTPTPGSPGAQGAPPDPAAVYKALWDQYQSEAAIVAKGESPDNPDYFSARDAMRSLGTQLATMSNNINNNQQKAANSQKATPSGDQPYPGGWTDENGKDFQGTWAQHDAWQAGLQKKTAELTKEAEDALKAEQTKSNIDIAQGKADLAQAQANYTNMLNDYKAQLSPMMSALSSSRDIADMTMRGPVIPALLGNMAPKGTNAAIVGMINGTKGVTPIPASSGLGQDQPMPFDVTTLGTQIAQNALNTLGPWASNAAAQASNGQIGSTTGNTTNSTMAGGTPAGGNPPIHPSNGAAPGGATPTNPTNPSITNSQPVLPPYMAPTMAQPPVPPAAGGSPMIGGGYVAGMNPSMGVR